MLFGLQWLVGLALAQEQQALPSNTQWKLLRQTEVTATSFLQSNWNKYTENYHPNYVADENPATAWVEGVEGNGEGQRLTLPTLPIANVRAVKLRIRNGFQKSETLLAANSAPETILVRIPHSPGQVTEHTASLTRTMGWQEVEVPLPPGSTVSQVEIEVRSVHPGKTYKDTCISDIQVMVDADFDYRPPIEEARFQKLLSWTKERLETAKYFASLPPTYPFASTEFQRVDWEKPEKEVAEKKLESLQSKLPTPSASGTRWKMTSRNGHLVVPDGLDEFSRVIDFFDPASLTWFETSDEYAYYRRESEDYGYHLEYKRNADIQFWPNAPAVPKVIAFESVDEGSERNEWKNVFQYTILCDESGRPSLIYQHKTSKEFDGTELSETSEIYVEVTWKDDKVARFTTTERVTTSRNITVYDGRKFIAHPK